MTKATLEALERVDQILHEAGWDGPVESPHVLTKEDLEALRHAYTSLLPPDHIEILERTLRKGATVEEAGREMHLPAETARRLLSEAFLRLSQFVNQSREQGVLVPGPASGESP